jgi:hypothetical protein
MMGGTDAGRLAPMRRSSGFDLALALVLVCVAYAVALALPVAAPAGDEAPVAVLASAPAQE